jgi:hypothetical protein
MSEKYEEIVDKWRVENTLRFEEGFAPAGFIQRAIALDVLRFADAERAKETCETCVLRDCIGCPLTAYPSVLNLILDVGRFGCIYHRRIEEVKG